MHKKVTTMLSASLLMTALAVPSTGFAIKNVAVDVEDNETLAESGYTIEFELEDELKDGDEIVIEFPSGTGLPNSISKSDVTINGEEPGNVEVDRSGDTVTLEVAEDFESGDDIEVVFDQDAGIENPEDEDDYTLWVKTTNEAWEESAEFSIEGDDSDSDEMETDLSSYKTGTEVEVELSFEAASDYSSGDTIEIEFPWTISSASDMDAADVTINGEEPDSVDVSGKILKLELAEDIEEGDDVNIVIDKVAGIKTPSFSTSGRIKVDAEGDEFESELIRITSSGSDDDEDEDYEDYFEVELDTYEPDKETSWRFEIELDGQTLEEGDWIEVEFPDDAMVPSSIDTEEVLIDGEEADDVEVDGETVEIQVPDDYDEEDTIEIEFTEDAGITTPEDEDSYTLTVTIDDTEFASEEFDIEGDSDSDSSGDLDVGYSLSTDYTNETTAVTVEVVDGMGVDLDAEDDYIAVVFPTNFQLPGSILPSKVKINGEEADSITVRSNKTVLVYLPEDLNEDEDVEITFDSTAGIKTPTAAGSYKIGVYSSADSDISYSDNISLVSKQAVQQPATVSKTLVLTVDSKNVIIDGAVTQQIEAAPYVYNMRTLVPLRFINEQFGAKVDWDNATRRITITNGTKQLILTPGSKTAYVNGSPITLEVPVQIKNGRSMVPLRFIVETLGAEVKWDGVKRQITIIKK